MNPNTPKLPAAKTADHKANENITKVHSPVFGKISKAVAAGAMAIAALSVAGWETKPKTAESAREIAIAMKMKETHERIIRDNPTSNARSIFTAIGAATRLQRQIYDLEVENTELQSIGGNINDAAIEENRKKIAELTKMEVARAIQGIADDGSVGSNEKERFIKNIEVLNVIKYLYVDLPKYGNLPSWKDVEPKITGAMIDGLDPALVTISVEETNNMELILHIDTNGKGFSGYEIKIKDREPRQEK